MSSDNLPVHSTLGASGAERWINCPGSVALLKTLTLPETDDPSFRQEGTAAHAAAATCLSQDRDGWEIVGETVEGVKVTAEMATAVQVYLDEVRPLIAKASQTFIEYPISQPKLHPLYYGTVDLGLVFEADGWLDITDYKHGVGIAVDVEFNPQVMYYAYGILQDFPDIRNVRLRIVQPRGFHRDGPIRVWETTAEALSEWAETTLIPAMNATAVDNTLDPGPWCRFCPAKIVCPMMTALFGAAAKANPDHVVNLSAEALGRSFQYVAAVKFYLKALEAEVLRRNLKGEEVPDTKLVYQKANRAYKPGAAEIIKARFGEDAMTKPEIKSPAEIEKLSPEAKELIKEWAFTPQRNVTVALLSDHRNAVKVTTSQDVFGAVAKQLEEGE